MTVDIFIQWIYTQKLMSIGAYACPHFQISRIKAAILGDRFQSPDFTKAVRYELISVLVESPLGASGEAAIYAFENLPAEDLLPNLLVDTAASHWKLYKDREELEDMEKRLPKAFLFRFMQRIIYQMHAGDDLEDWDFSHLDECDYHGHEDRKDELQCQRQARKL